MAVIDDVRSIVATTLQLGPRAESLRASSHLLGAVPEFDSMAVVTVITAIEDHFGFVVDDDEIDAAVFETLGSLSRFVDAKLDG